MCSLRRPVGRGGRDFLADSPVRFPESRTLPLFFHVKYRGRNSDTQDMGKKMTIVIEVDPDAREITVRDDAGNERPVKSIMVFGGDAERGKLYLFGWGASADAAWAYKEGFLHAHECDDARMKNFYRQCACHIAQCACPGALRPEDDAEELLARWESEDCEQGTWH